MTVKGLAGIVACDVDAETGEQLDHRIIYQRIIDKIGGLDAIIPLLPYGIDMLKTALSDDMYFNNLPKHVWEKTAGFTCSLGACHLVGSPLVSLLSKHDVTIMSCAENVCILKEAARLWVECSASVPVDDLL